MSYFAGLSFCIYVALIALPLKLSSRWYDLYHRTTDWYKRCSKTKRRKKNLQSKPTKEGKNGSFSPLAIQFPHPFEEEEFELWLIREEDESFFDEDPKEVKSFRAEILLSKSIFIPLLLLPHIYSREVVWYVFSRPVVKIAGSRSSRFSHYQSSKVMWWRLGPHKRKS